MGKNLQELAKLNCTLYFISSFIYVVLSILATTVRIGGDSDYEFHFLDEENVMQRLKDSSNIEKA